jgi:cytochrome c556
MIAKRPAPCISAGFAVALVIAAGGAGDVRAAEADPRTPIRLPADMRVAFLAEMRTHMDSLDDIIAAIAGADFKAAAKVARDELMPGSGKGFGRYLPIEFRELGLDMHRAAADFAAIADAAAAPPTDADWRKVLTALNAISQHCRACHDAFRVE